MLQFPPDDAVRCWEDHHVTALAAIGSPLKEYGQVGPTVKSGQLRGGKVSSLYRNALLKRSTVMESMRVRVTPGAPLRISATIAESATGSVTRHYVIGNENGTEQSKRKRNRSNF